MGGNIICDECEMPLSSKRLLDIHKRAKHFENPDESKCDLCNNEFKTKPQLKKHRYEKHSESRFQKLTCDRCNQTFSNIHTRINHTLRIHLKEKNESCDKCSYTGFSTDDVRLHNMNKHSDETPYKCLLCPRAFKRKAFLTAHLKDHSRSPMAKPDIHCKHCGKIKRTKEGAKNCCAPKDIPKEDFLCSESSCDRIFTNYPALKYHIKTKHFPNPYLCHVCDKSFATSSDLRRHKFYIHEQKERPISCPKCPKKWKSKDGLKRHLMSHEKKKFACSFVGCNVVRNIEYGIRHHFRLKHGKVMHTTTLEERLEKVKAQDNRIPCTICKLLIKSGKSAKYYMKRHQQNHIGNDMMPCPIADCTEKVENPNYYGFNLPGIFSDHLDKAHSITRNSHSVSVTFRCKICNKTEKIWNQNSRNNEFWKLGTRPGNFWKQNSNMWIDFLRRHLSQKHKQASDEVKDFKLDWQKYFENGAILIETKISNKDDLDEILQHQCKLCDWQYHRKGTKISERLALTAHYCTYHFGEPMQNCADTNIVDNFCVQCKKKYSFQNNVKRMVHLGYYHKELYKYLRGDASIDLTPFRERKEVKEKTYRCENCGTVFQRKVALMSHIKYHCVVTPFPCESCEKTYTASKDLKIHKMIHGRKKIYQQNISTCDMCWKIFSKKCTLKRHQHLMHTQKDYTCKICGQVSNTQHGHRIHILYHNMNESFLCDKCNKGFYTQAQLTRHKKNHETILPAVCEVCEKNFKRKESLDKHKCVVHLRSKDEARKGTKLSKQNILNDLINDCENLIKDPVH